MENMSGKLPGKRYRKDKEVFMWHVAGPKNWSVAITPQRMYWSERIWKHRDFMRFPEALAYAKKLAAVLENGQQRIEVLGSPFVSWANLDGSEVITQIPGKSHMIDMDVDRAIDFAETAERLTHGDYAAIEAGRRAMQ